MIIVVLVGAIRDMRVCGRLVRMRLLLARMRRLEAMREWEDGGFVVSAFECNACDLCLGSLLKVVDQVKHHSLRLEK